MQSTRIIDGYQVLGEVGKGAFGTVVKVKQAQIDSKRDQTEHHQVNPIFHHKQCQQFAMKIENINIVKPMLHLEYQIFKQLNKKQSIDRKGYGFSKVYCYKQSDYFSYMVMDLYAISLQDFANKQLNNKLQKDILIRLFYNILCIIQQLHKIGYLHRDVKPSNFMLKIKKNLMSSKDQFKQQIQKKQNKQKYQEKIYPIDLGLCKKYIKTNSNAHIPIKFNKMLVGTPLFCSLNTHKGIQQSRRDDIQSLVYMITYLVKKLPWEKAAGKIQEYKKSPSKKTKQVPQSPTKVLKKEQKMQKFVIYDQISDIKKSTDMFNFLTDLLVPQCFWQILKYSYSLKYEETPDYNHIKDLLQKNYDKIAKKKEKLQQIQCYWSSNMKNSQNQLKEVDKEPKSKIKINFKIPQKKIKPPAQKKQMKDIIEKNTQ